MYDIIAHDWYKSPALQLLTGRKLWNSSSSELKPVETNAACATDSGVRFDLHNLCNIGALHCAPIDKATQERSIHSDEREGLDCGGAL